MLFMPWRIMMVVIGAEKNSADLLVCLKEVSGVDVALNLKYDDFANRCHHDNCQCPGDLRRAPSGNHMPMPSQTT
jgi:hypothetical protein